VRVPVLRSEEVTLVSGELHSAGLFISLLRCARGVLTFVLGAAVDISGLGGLRGFATLFFVNISARDLPDVTSLPQI
jgi:hypothetical protein